jgi:hypothetical protein
MKWGEKKLTQICKEEMGLDPALGGAFLFYNSKLDQLKLLFFDDTGCQEITKLISQGGFMVPMTSGDEKYIRIDGAKLTKLFNTSR